MNAQIYTYIDGKIDSCSYVLLDISLEELGHQQIVFRSGVQTFIICKIGHLPLFSEAPK